MASYGSPPSPWKVLPRPVGIDWHTAPLVGSTQYSWPVSPPNRSLPAARTGAEACGFWVVSARSTMVSPHVESVLASQQNSAIGAVWAMLSVGYRWVQKRFPTIADGPT